MTEVHDQTLESLLAEIASKNAALERQIESAREHDAWLELALDAGRVGIWRWDPATRRVVISTKLAEWIGMGDTLEIDTDDWGRRIHREDTERVATTIGDAVDRKEPFELEYRVLDAADEPRWLRVTGRLVGLAGAQHVFGTAVDVTEQRQLDEQLRLADRLIAAGTLAAGVAHEINNPLTYVLGNIELLQRRLRDHAVPEAMMMTESLAQMLEGLERIRDVVTDLRSFARPEEDVIGRLELSAVCNAAIRLVSSVVRHRAAVVTDYAADAPAVIANESRLGQVIINLIVNASHALPERGTVESTITVRTRRLPTGEAAIAVEDNGTGIAPSIVPRLFDPFFTTKRSGVGTGLGLSVCQSIVASLHGRIDVDTALGRGTTFTVVLPAAPPILEQPKAPRREPSEIAGLKVLVIDDEPLVRRTLSRVLVSHGCEVTEAEGGVTGLELASTGPFDLVVCDLMMPDLDGAMLHDELARRRPPLAAKMVFISGGAVTERTREFAGRPGVVLIPKPFAVDQLVSALAESARR